VDLRGGAIRRLKKRTIILPVEGGTMGALKWIMSIGRD